MSDGCRKGDDNFPGAILAKPRIKEGGLLKREKGAGAGDAGNLKFVTCGVTKVCRCLIFLKCERNPQMSDFQIISMALWKRARLNSVFNFY